MDKLNKPYLMALALKQSELLIESTHMLQDMLTSLSTSTDSDTDKLKKLSDLVTHVANMETLTKLKQFVIDNANKKNPPPGIDIKPLETLPNEAEDAGSSVGTADDDAYSALARPTIYKLPANTPIFQAKGVSVDEWFYVMEQALELANIPRSKVLSLVSSYVTGTALQLLIAYSDTIRADWNGFKAILREHFLPQRRLRQQLVSLRCTESIDGYNKKFLSLVTQIVNITETDKLFYYVEGLHAQAKFQVLSKEPGSLTLAMAIATQYETCINKAKETKVEEVNVTRRYNRPQVNKPSSSPKQSGGSMKPAYIPGTKVTVKCFKCGKQGHYAKDSRITKRVSQLLMVAKGAHTKPAQLLTLNTVQHPDTLPMVSPYHSRWTVVPQFPLLRPASQKHIIYPF